jgi:hypothetical protein
MLIRMRWAWHVAGLGEKWNAYRILMKTGGNLFLSGPSEIGRHDCGHDQDFSKKEKEGNNKVCPPV